MARVLRMPGISADAEEVVFLEWCATPGSQVAVGDAIATVETEKANVDIESDQEAVLWRTLIEPGDSVGVGSPIAVLVDIDEEIKDEAELLTSLGLIVGALSSNEAKVPDPTAGVESSDTDSYEPVVSNDANSMAAAGSNGRIFSSPLARKLARENAISLENIIGTGPGRRIVRADIERVLANRPALASREDAPPRSIHEAGRGFTDMPHSGLRRAIARSLSASKRDAPHFYLDATCRVDGLLELRHEINESGSVKISINDFIVKAVAKALIAVPDMNVVWMDDCVRRFDAADISIAIGSSSGLVTPVLRSADRMSLTEISDQVKDFTSRANEGRLKQHELEGGSFSISNLGMFGVERFTAIINPPQAGILAVGAVAQSAIVHEGVVEVASTMKVTLSADHRPVDGVAAALWLRHFQELIERPALMLI